MMRAWNNDLDGRLAQPGVDVRKRIADQQWLFQYAAACCDSEKGEQDAPGQADGISPR
jgi:hypothetical protein